MQWKRYIQAVPDCITVCELPAGEELVVGWTIVTKTLPTTDHA
jgi:hypothetical protein